MLLGKAAMPKTRMVKVFNHLHSQICTTLDGSSYPSIEKPLLFALRLGLSFDRQKDTLSELCPSLPAHPMCLACFFLDPDGTDPHSDKGKIVMIDGISKLANQKRESKEKFYPYKDKLFIPQMLTDAFESQLGDLKEGANNGCSQHSAAEKAQSTRKGQTYESTATFTSTCRHHSPVKFVSMKFGERYAYPILLLLVLSVFINKWSYDICCLLLPGIIKVIANRMRFLANYASSRGPDYLLSLVQKIIEYRERCGLGQPYVSSSTSTSASSDLVQAELSSIQAKPAGVGLCKLGYRTPTCLYLCISVCIVSACPCSSVGVSSSLLAQALVWLWPDRWRGDREATCSALSLCHDVSLHEVSTLFKCRFGLPITVWYVRADSMQRKNFCQRLYD
jgi:hypothetical protein